MFCKLSQTEEDWLAQVKLQDHDLQQERQRNTAAEAALRRALQVSLFLILSVIQ